MVTGAAPDLSPLVAYNLSGDQTHTNFVTASISSDAVWAHNCDGPSNVDLSKTTSGSNSSVDINEFSKRDRRAYNSLAKRIDEHEHKLEELKANPTIRLGMENQSPEIIAAAQERRILHLEREIAAFRKNQTDIRKKYE